VGEHDQRALRIGIARLCDDVPGALAALDERAGRGPLETSSAIAAPAATATTAAGARRLRAARVAIAAAAPASDSPRMSPA
jgi:hypothetical protein